MKQQIRKGVFETNSSSTHAMAVQTAPNVLYGIYTNMSDEDIDKYNEQDDVKNGWRCKILHKSDLPAIIKFHGDEFGWEVRTYTSDNYEAKASYLWTLMSELLSYEEFDEAVKHFTKWFEEEGIIPEFQEYERSDYSYLGECSYLPSHVKLIPGDDDEEDKWFYVDHADDAEDFVLYVISRKNNLFNYLFGDSFIKTGNDNVDCDISLCTEDEHWSFDCTHKKFYKGN